MPIAMNRDDEQRRITVTVTDPWSAEEIAVLITRQASEPAWKYGTLYDLRGSTGVPVAPDMLWLLKRGQTEVALHGARGPVAVLIDGSSQAGLLQQYAEYGGEHSHVLIRVFDDAGAAHAWLDAHRLE